MSHQTVSTLYFPCLQLQCRVEMNYSDLFSLRTKLQTTKLTLDARVRVRKADQQKKWPTQPLEWLMWNREILRRCTPTRSYRIRHASPGHPSRTLGKMGDAVQCGGGPNPGSSLSRQEGELGRLQDMKWKCPTDSVLYEEGRTDQDCLTVHGPWAVWELMDSRKFVFRFSAC